jgi:pilus assembly protein CpaC
MHPMRNARRPLLRALLLLGGLSATVTSGQQPMPMQPMPMQPTAGDVQIDKKTGALIVPLNGLVSFDPKLDKGDLLTDIIVAREDILQVRVDPANPARLLLSGKAAGLTQLVLVIKDKPKRSFEVIVQPDLDLLRALIRRTVPTAAVDVQPGVGNVIVVSGYVTSPQDADIVSRLATSAVGNVNNVINAVQVGGGQQVQIDVVIASVDRNLLRSRGFDFAFRGGSVNFNSIVSGLITGGTTLTDAPILSPDANLQIGVVPNQFFGALRALRSEGVAKFIAEPRVITQSGRAAFFRAGGQQAIVGPAAGITGPGVQLVPFGTELEVVPIVYGNGMIWLEINPRISAVSQALGINIGGANSPGFTEQQVRTAVMLESGQTFAIGGLIQNSVQASAAKIPVLGELPFIGTGFSRVTHELRESELVILVTPRLVGPMNCDQVPRRLPGRESRSPDDYELFLENILEAPRGQRKVWNGRCYQAAYRCDPTAAIFPCVGNVCTGSNAYGPVCGPRGHAVPVANSNGSPGAGVTVPPAATSSAPARPTVTPVAEPTGAQPMTAPVPVSAQPAAPPVPVSGQPVPVSILTAPSGRGTPEPEPIPLPGLPPPVVVLPDVPRN